MAESNRYPDNELLAYLMGEGDPDFRSALAREIEQIPELAARLTSLNALCGQLRQLPVEIFYRKRRPVSALSLIVKAVVLAGIFFTGALAQSEFLILQNHLDTPKQELSNLSGDFSFSSRIVM